VLDTIEQDGVLGVVATRAAQLRLGIADLAAGTGAVREVRGLGLLLGIVLAAPVAADVAARCRAERLIVNAVGADVIRLAPPLTVSAAEVEQALGVLDRAISAAHAAHGVEDAGADADRDATSAGARA